MGFTCGSDWEIFTIYRRLMVTSLWKSVLGSRWVINLKLAIRIIALMMEDGGQI
jgi:hypothetical protein